jgi:rhodanese-related sulfurtransferase
MGLLDLFSRKGISVAEAVEQGAKIVDVRSPGEFAGGHVKGSVNMPLPELDKHLSKIEGWKKPVITVCASGMRSARAASIIKRAGVEAVNGGAWQNLN